ncbi:hypothetical protein CDD82_7060 [Ophiocordyceps australis]|uniref:Uncharacterized protein n=1 Tax=Ophiocordyceps australis TaxID=1399860 RepID=A0A2C5YS16_9HYPO|nr:hypothetical protein CDD82_7060 [Ophiocordyceps australis]
MDKDDDEGHAAQAWAACHAAQDSPRNNSLLACRAASELTSQPSHYSEPPLRCCCGLVDCALLKHNYSVLRDVERDVHMAADLGKVRLTLVGIQAHSKPLPSLVLFFVPRSSHPPKYRVQAS